MGKRQCELAGCSKWIVAGGTPHCMAHGGGRRCQLESCTKGAATGGTPHCISHGGGRRCQHDGCLKSAVAGGTPHCISHGGGKRMPTRGLRQVRSRRHPALVMNLQSSILMAQMTRSTS
jgi:hypothetical protein